MFLNDIKQDDLIQIVIILSFIAYLNATKTDKNTTILLAMILVGAFYYCNNNVSKENFNTCGSSHESYSKLKNNNIFERAKGNWDDYRKRNDRIHHRDKNRYQNNLNKYIINKNTQNYDDVVCEDKITKKVNNSCSNRDEIEKKIDELKYMLNNTCF